MLWLLSGIGAMILMAFYIFRSIGIWCELFAWIFLAPVLFHMYVYICSYDDGYGKWGFQQEARREEKAEIYGLTLREVQDNLQKAVDGDAGFAQSAFQSRKKEFVRFVGWIAEHELDDKMNRRMKRCVAFWLKVFEETSIDPAEHPRVGAPAVFQQIVHDIYKAPPAAPARPETPTNSGLFLAPAERSVTGARASSSASRLGDTDSVLATQRVENGWVKLRERIEAEDVLFINAEKDSIETLMQERAEFKAASKQRIVMLSDDSRRLPDWIRTDEPVDAREIPADTLEHPPGTYPVRFHSGDYTITVLDEGHLWLLFGLLVTVLLFIFYVVDYWTFDRKDCGDYAHIAILFGLLAIMFCLRLLLWNLYHIYTVMQIEADIRNLDYTLALLIEDRVRIGAFVSADSTLVNFWIYHTIP
jgi:hypothetical protein